MALTFLLLYVHDQHSQERGKALAEAEMGRGSSTAEYGVLPQKVRRREGNACGEDGESGEGQIYKHRRCHAASALLIQQRLQRH